MINVNMHKQHTTYSRNKKSTAAPYFQGEEKGFTLVELSIVMVIIGLLIGGIISAQSMVKTARLTAVIDEQQKIMTSVQLFKQKYDYLPGDLPNASNYFSSCNNDLGAACNGNGDGKVYSPYNAPTPEGILAWRHLSEATMYPGIFTGQEAANFKFSEAEVNVPGSKYPGGTWNFLNTYETYAVPIHANIQNDWMFPY